MPAARKPTARTAVLALPSRSPALSLPRLLPSGRTLLIGFGVIAAALGGYLLAKGTSMFAVEKVQVTGARQSVVRRVDSVLAPLEGTSLLSLNAAAIDRRLSALPDVKLVSYDRAFPHTMRVVVSAERPVAVLRRGTQAWLVTDRGRNLQRLTDPAALDLPRIWTADVPVPAAGELLTTDEALRPALALGQVLSADRTFFGRVREARFQPDGIVLVLRTGTEVRLGPADEIPLQIAVANRVLEAVGQQVRYVDVSVPERAVVG